MLCLNQVPEIDLGQFNFKGTLKMKLKKNICLNVDSYKVGMDKMYPLGTTHIYSYVESRGGIYDKTLFFGLQAFIKEYLLEPITQADIDIADEILSAHGEPFNRSNWQYILEHHGGYLPLIIKAVPEGTVVPVKNVLATIENSDPKCYWLTTWIETALLRAIWYPTTVATRSHKIRQVILDYLEKTGDPTLIDFKLHDFGARGVSSLDSAAIGAAAHLINFMGTDTISGVLYAREYYNAGISGFSIPASEHSISSSYGKNEKKYVLNMISQFAKPGAIFAMVADTHNVFEFAKMLGDDPEIKEKIITHGNTGGFVVIRPDSGDPLIVCRNLIEILGDKFGYTVNSKGFKVLNYVRIIQGDGVNELTIHSILSAFMAFGWSADNIAFGMGGALLQICDRDTLKFAMKASAARVNGEWHDVFKDPSTDSGKTSKKGKVTLWESGGEFQTAVKCPTNWVDKGLGWTPALKKIFDNGKLITEYSFQEIRDRAKNSIY